MAEFIGYGKTPRLFRDIIITQKLNGTNACVVIEQDEVAAQSRNRLITPEQDNAGFARWVYDNETGLRETLGLGRFYGEWFGSKIQNGEGLTNGERRFALFNTSRFSDVDLSSVIGLTTVPVLYQGPFSEKVIKEQLELLVQTGSHAVPGFMNVEGIVVFHVAANKAFKFTVDDEHKG